jgi:dTDP-glucose 4,6-dehydratase
LRVIITGGAGFIGGHAVKHFVSQGDTVLNIDKLTYAASHKNTTHSDFIELDIRDANELKSIVKNYKPDYVINFAAETHVDNSINSINEFISSNVEGVVSVLNVCKETNVKLCHISTDEVYGPATNKPFTENDQLNPMNPYAATKAAGDLLIKSFNNTYKLPYLILRPSNNYGPDQNKEKFIPKLIDAIRHGKKFPLYGDGLQVREWTYVKDTVQIIRKIIVHENEWNSTYNITSGISKPNLEVIQKTLSIYNQINEQNLDLNDVIQHVEDRKGHDKKYWIESDKINKIISHDHAKFDDVIKEIITHKE